MILGQDTDYPTHYDPTLLIPIPRKNPDSNYHGLDQWTLYELSWLRDAHTPEVAIGHLIIPCQSSHTIESKSLKLYLNSLNNHILTSKESLIKTITDDLKRVLKTEVSITIHPLDDPIHTPTPLSGNSLDHLPVLDWPETDISPLKTKENTIHTTWHTHRFRANCPVTNQPDWASIWIDYEGPEINPKDLLSYLVSFRNHQGFHEQCIETILHDIVTHCTPKHCSVYGRFTRRGGIDINPFRSTLPHDHIPHKRQVRQ